MIMLENVSVQNNSLDFFKRSVPPLSEKALPIITFSSYNMTIYQNDDEINIIHMDNGHTDGDSVVYFSKE